jgi:hypothetical protein
MPDLKYRTSKGLSLLAVAVFVLCASTAAAQSATDHCRPAAVIPLTGSEPPAKIVIDPPLAEPLASRGVAIIQYCAQNLHLVPVFGPKCSGCLAARRTHSYQSRRCPMGVGRYEWSTHHPDGSSPWSAQSAH